MLGSNKSSFKGLLTRKIPSTTKIKFNKKPGNLGTSYLLAETHTLCKFSNGYYKDLEQKLHREERYHETRCLGSLVYRGLRLWRESIILMVRDSNGRNTLPPWGGSDLPWNCLSTSLTLSNSFRHYSDSKWDECSIDQLDGIRVPTTIFCDMSQSLVF